MSLPLKSHRQSNPSLAYERSLLSSRTLTLSSVLLGILPFPSIKPCIVKGECLSIIASSSPKKFQSLSVASFEYESIFLLSNIFMPKIISVCPSITYNGSPSILHILKVSSSAYDKMVLLLNISMPKMLSVCPISTLYRPVLSNNGGLFKFLK